MATKDFATIMEELNEVFQSYKENLSDEQSAYEVKYYYTKMQDS